MPGRYGQTATLRCDFDIALQRMAPHERMITMIARLLTPVLIAGAAAAGIALAPVAAAGTTDCTETPMTSICQRPGHSSIYTSPNMPDQNSSIGWPMGVGPVPPIMAMN